MLSLVLVFANSAQYTYVHMYINTYPHKLVGAPPFDREPVVVDKPEYAESGPPFKSLSGWISSGRTDNGPTLASSSSIYLQTTFRANRSSVSTSKLLCVASSSQLMKAGTLRTRNCASSRLLTILWLPICTLPAPTRATTTTAAAAGQG